MTEFKIRAYGRMELAQLYSPTLTDIASYRCFRVVSLYCRKGKRIPGQYV